MTIVSDWCRVRVWVFVPRWATRPASKGRHGEFVPVSFLSQRAVFVPSGSQSGERDANASRRVPFFNSPCDHVVTAKVVRQGMVQRARLILKLGLEPAPSCEDRILSPRLLPSLWYWAEIELTLITGIPLATSRCPDLASSRPMGNPSLSDQQLLGHVPLAVVLSALFLW